VIAVALFLLAGLGWARRLDPEAWVGEALLLGSGIAALSLIGLDVVGVPWSRGGLLLATAVLAAAAMYRRPPAGCTGDLRPPWRRDAAHTAGRRPAVQVALLNGLTGLIVLLHALTPAQWSPAHYIISRRDVFFIWGAKGHLFFVEHAIPWRFLASLPSDFGHPDYPLLVPLLFDVQAVLSGRWQPEAFAIIDTALGAALLLIVYRCLRDEFTPLFAAAGTLALSGCALLPWPGFADGPLVAYAASAALLLRRGASQSRLPAILLALAVMTKNEGLAFIAATAVALALTDRKLLKTLWPAALVAGIWLAARLALGLHTDLFAPGLFARAGHNLARFPQAFANISVYQPLAWIGALAGIALAPAQNLRRERFLLTIVGLQLAFYLAAYTVTPLDVVGHVNGSWDRISSHVTMLLAFAGVTSIGEALRR
jgi:hypothetical protein